MHRDGKNLAERLVDAASEARGQRELSIAPADEAVLLALALGSLRNPPKRHAGQPLCGGAKAVEIAVIVASIHGP
jgi:hypothetical protein